MRAVQQPLAQIHALLERQALAVLATRMRGRPYASLLAFAVTPDRRAILFVTRRATTKYRNIVGEPRVALLIDDRVDVGGEIGAVTAVTLLGTAAEVDAKSRPALLEHLLQRHPQIARFARAPATALFRVALRSALLVTRFQQVQRIDLRRRAEIRPALLVARAPRRR